ncbi:MAG TPA: tetratricopeptide repeat protein [Chloroflexia bacterium]|nr:tetratricopeptide repeat protein [Chloroflexia bacterium]
MTSFDLQSADTYLTRARASNKSGQLEAALASYREAARLFSEARDERGLARCWSGMAKVYGKQKELGLSIEAFQQAAEHASLAGWYEKELENLYNLGLSWQQLGVKGANLAQVGKAVAAFQKALEIARRLDDRQSAGVLLISLGFACDWMKYDEKAILYFKEAAPFALDNVDFDTAFSALSSLGVLLSNHNRAVEAIPYYERALELAKSAEGDLVAVADTYANLGIAYEKADRLEEALEAIDTYREILHVSGDVKAAQAAAMVKRLKQKLENQARRR